MNDTLSPDQNIIIRDLQPAQDLPRWLRLIHTIEREKTGDQKTTAEHLRRALGWPRMRRWVIESPSDPEMLVAYALLYTQIPERCALDVTVHPDWRRRGIGSRLLAHLLEQARKSGAEYAYGEIDEKNTLALAFLRKSGFYKAGDVWLLRAGAEVDFAIPRWPEGYTMRTYEEVGDLRVLVEACNRGFGDMWGHQENTAGGVTAEEISGWLEYWDPRGIFLVFSPNGSVVGSCRAETGSPNGKAEDLVDEPGIDPKHRGLQLQRPMVLTALRWLRKQGRRPVRLESWGDTPETVALYQELGFKLVEHALSMAYSLK